MKRTILYILTAFSLSMSAQRVTISEPQKIQTPSNKRTFYPILSNDGSKLLFTSENYQGVSQYNISDKYIKVISRKEGAGYDATFSQDGAEVYYKEQHKREGKIYRSLMKFDQATGTSIEVIAPQRSIKQPQVGLAGQLKVVAEGKLIERSSSRSLSNIPYIYSNEGAIDIYQNGQKKTIRPLANEASTYIWCSLSPDKNRLLFVVPSKGCYISDLDGNNVKFIGQIESPVWFNDDYVVGMITEDDGYFFTSSRIVLTSIKDGVEYQLSSNIPMAMYPSVAISVGRVAFNTLSGEIYIIDVTIK
ncbi:MAG: hypothetical protein ACRC6R_02970 [Bacteroidales bacterium]